MRNRTSYNTFELMKCVGIFQVGFFWVVILQGNAPVGSLMGGNFPGRSFPRVNFPRTNIT